VNQSTTNPAGGEAVKPGTNSPAQYDTLAAVGGKIGGQLQSGAFTVRLTEQLPVETVSKTSVPEGTPSINQMFPPVLLAVPADVAKLAASVVTLKL
jgi:hypothetical protein